jgi:ubiquinone/menaquinone biosynthesis C-methylase UbiE
LTVGSGLGDDAEELSHRGFQTTAFDISASAIAWSRKRFPQSKVTYIRADLFDTPKTWQARFNFVLELYTLQVLPPDLRSEAAGRIASFLAPEGMLLVIARAREPDEPKGQMPWPLTLDELQPFEAAGLQIVEFEDYRDQEDPPVRRFRVAYQR